MRKFLEPYNDRNREGNPENGATRIQKTSDSSMHLQIFYNGSWRHDNNCKIKTNKECNITWYTTKIVIFSFFFCQFCKIVQIQFIK